MAIELPRSAPVPAAAAARTIKWSRNPKVREQQLKNPNYHPPAHHGVPAPHAAPARRQPSLIEMSPAQIADRAKRIVNAEVAAERLPFQQRATQLGGEEAGAVQAHQQDYSQLDAGTAALQTKQAESAKSFQNVAADMVKKAEAQAPITGAEGSAERRQQENARNLLVAMATSGQSASNANQQAEGAFLTNIRSAGQMEGVAGTKQIQGEYGKKKQEVSNQEAQINAGKPGRVGKLVLGMEGEKEKLKLAAGTLGIKGKEAERHGAETESNIRKARTGEKIAAGNLKLGERKAAFAERPKPESKSERLNNQKKELEIKKFLEGPNSTGKPLSRHELGVRSSELNAAFSTFQRGRAAGVSPEGIREALEQGGHHYTPSEKELAAEQKARGITFSKKELETKRKGYFVKGPKVTEPAILKAAEDIMQKEYVGTETKKELRELGLPDSGWSNRFIHHGPTAVGQSHSRNRAKRGY